MTAMRIFPLSGGGIGVEDLIFPKARLEGDIDPTVYRLRASGELPSLPNRPFIPVDELCGVVLRENEDDTLTVLGTRAQLLFVAFGWLELARHEGPPVRFDRGDLLLIEESSELDGALRHGEGTKLVAFRLAGEWPAEGEPLKRDEGEEAPTLDLNIRSMRQAADGSSYFTDFDQLFQTEAGSCSEARATHGIYFAEAKDGTFIDMHPEVQTNLVLVLAGHLELEVSGAATIEHFRTGDIVLAADRTGEGHIDRFHGTTTLLAATMAEDVAHQTSGGGS